MSGIFSLFIILALFGAMVYFLMIRPMRQREKKHDYLVDSLENGEMVITAGGIYGTINSLQEDSVILKVESGAMIKVTKGAIVRREEDL